MAIHIASSAGRNLTTKLASRLAIGALALGFCLSAMPASAQQNPQNSPQQQGQQPDQQPQQDQQQQDQQQDQASPNQGTPDDRGPMPPADARQDQQPPPQENNYVVPDTLTLPAGTILQVRTMGWLSSDHNKPGDQVTMALAQPLVVDGLVVARRGQTVMGTVTSAEKAGRVKGVSKLGLGLAQLTLVDGQLIDIKTSLINATGGTTKGRDAAAIAGTTGFGAAVGAAASGGEGAAIGAGAGFVASVVGVLLTRGRPTIIPPESLLTFRLEAPVTVSTVHGQTAFRPVTSRDYAPKPQPRRVARPYYPYGPPPPYGYYPYAYYPYAYGPYPYRYYP